MIIQTYPNPNAPVVVTTSFTPRVLGTATPPKNAKLMANGLMEAHNAYYARKFNISIDEFVRRDVMIKGFAEHAKQLESGKKYYPHNEEKIKERGLCTIRYIYRNYGDFDRGAPWDENEAAFIVGATDCYGNHIVTTANFFDTKEQA